MPTGETLGATTRQNHHIELNEAICSLEKVRDELKRLLDRICDTDESPLEQPDKKNIPPLAEVLTSGADRIHSYQDVCLKLISEIETLLF